MHNLTLKNIAAIEELAVFYMQNIINDSNIVANHNSIIYTLALIVYEEIFPEPSSNDIDDILFSLFKLYIEYYNHESFSRAISNLNKLSLDELKGEALSLEKKLHIYSNMQNKILKYLTTLVMLRECTELIYGLTIHYDSFSLESIISKLRGINQEIYSFKNDPILHSECTYITKLLQAYNHVSEHYLLTACTTLDHKCGNDEEGLLEYINTCQLEYEKLTPEPWANFLTIFKRQSDTKIQKILQILLSYAKLCLIRARTYTDIEAHILMLDEAMQELKSVTDKRMSDMLNLSATYKAIAEKYMPAWRKSGKIYSREELVKIIDCLANWKYYLSGKHLQRALRMKLETEIEYIEHLKTDELLKYYDYMLHETIGVQIKVHPQNTNPIQCRALISTQLFRLYQAIGERLDLIAPGWSLPKVANKSGVNILDNLADHIGLNFIIKYPIAVQPHHVYNTATTSEQHTQYPSKIPHI